MLWTKLKIVTTPVLVISLLAMGGTSISRRTFAGQQGPVANAADDLETINGEWSLMGYRILQSGLTSVAQDEPDWHIEKGKIDFRYFIAVASSKELKWGDAATYRVDPSKHPKTIDLEWPDGKKMQGIYLLVDDVLAICLGSADGQRPTTFTADAGQQLLQFQREKPKKGKPVARLTSGGAASEDDPARAIIEKALQATGGAKSLAQNQASTWAGRGVFPAFGGMHFWVQGARDGADRFAIKTVSRTNAPVRVDDAAGRTFTRALVVNGTRGWLLTNGKVHELDKEELGEEKERYYGNWVASLFPLEDRKFRLKYLGKDKLGDRAVAGVEVSKDGHLPVRLFFDKESGLLAKRVTRRKNPRQPEKEITEELIYSDYKPVNGVKHAFMIKLLVDGRLTTETEITACHTSKKLDDGYFVRPESEK